MNLGPEFVYLLCKYYLGPHFRATFSGHNFGPQFRATFSGHNFGPQFRATFVVDFFYGQTWFVKNWNFRQKLNFPLIIEITIKKWKLPSQIEIESGHIESNIWNFSKNIKFFVINPNLVQKSKGKKLQKFKNFGSSRYTQGWWSCSKWICSRFFTLPVWVTLFST